MSTFDKQGFGRDKRSVEDQLRELLIDPLSGDTFPVNPSNGDRFFNTGNRLEYYWHLAAELWLTTTRYNVALPVAPGGLGELTADGYVAIPIPHTNEDQIYMEVARVLIIPTLATGANYFNLYLSGVLLAGALDFGQIDSVNLGSVRTLIDVAVNRPIPLNTAGLTAYAEKVGAAGSHSFYVAFNYRLIGA